MRGSKSLSLYMHIYIYIYIYIYCLKQKLVHGTQNTQHAQNNEHNTCLLRRHEDSPMRQSFSSPPWLSSDILPMYGP